MRGPDAAYVRSAAALRFIWVRCFSILKAWRQWHCLAHWPGRNDRRRRAGIGLDNNLTRKLSSADPYQRPCMQHTLSEVRTLLTVLIGQAPTVLNYHGGRSLNW